MEPVDLTQIPQSVRYEIDKGGKLRRFDKASGRMIPQYVSLAVNPLDGNYKVALPLREIHHDPSKGSKRRWVDQNGVPIAQGNRVDVRAFRSPFQMVRLAQVTPMKAPPPRKIQNAEVIANAMFKAMAEMPEYKQYFDDNCRPLPATIEEVYYGFFRLLLSEDESAVRFAKRLFDDFHRDPIATFERMEKLRKDKNGVTVVNKLDGEKLIQTIWIPPTEEGETKQIEKGQDGGDDTET